MAGETLTSARHNVENAVEAIEFCYRMGWTDGLPVIPATEERVRECLEHAGKAAQDVVGNYPERGRIITAEKVAINAVMAGCLPSYTPVVMAAVEAITRPEFRLVGCASSTGGSAMLMIVSGPIVQQLGMNAKGNVFGPGNRANATIGRAIRLVLMNICGAIPGVFDRSALGHPGKYSYCIAEDEETSPWEPLRVEQGFPADVSTVTVVASEAPHYVNNHFSPRAEGVLTTVADTIKGTAYQGGKYVLVLVPEHVAMMKKDGWSKRDLKQFVAEHTGRTVADLKQCGRVAGEVVPGDENETRYAVEGPEDLIVIAAGGEGGAFSAVVPPWGGGRYSLPQTQAIGVCIDCA